MLKNIKFTLIKLSHFLLSDKISLRLIFLLKNKPLNLKIPTTFTDKLNYLKVYERKSIMSILSDKILLKQHVRSIQGLFTAKIYFSDNKLPKQGFEYGLFNFNKKIVIKTNHFSGDARIIDINDLYNEKKVKNINNYFGHFLKLNPYDYPLREWSYKNINKKLLIEEYLGDNLTDYKFFCFNGKPKLVHVVEDRRIKIKDYFLNLEWENLGFSMSKRSFLPNIVPQKPKLLPKMIEYASVLSKDLKFVRVDFYIVGDKIYIGEMTFYPWGGMFDFKSTDGKNWDKILGDMLNIN